MINLNALKTIEKSATPRPWANVPYLQINGCPPLIVGADQRMIVAFRNVLPEILHVLECVNAQAMEYNNVLATFIDGQPTTETTEAHEAYGAACIKTLQSQDKLIHMQALLEDAEGLPELQPWREKGGKA